MASKPMETMLTRKILVLRAAGYCGDVQAWGTCKTWFAHVLFSCRLKAEAEARAAGGKEPEKKKPIVVKYGINHITHLVESGKAQMVVIAHDVDPLELVVWLPALCKKMGVPYAIVKVWGPCTGL